VELRQTTNIEHWSFTLDMMILLRPVLAAFRVPECNTHPSGRGTDTIRVPCRFPIPQLLEL
jgi:hypothetical protein